MVSKREIGKLIHDRISNSYDGLEWKMDTVAGHLRLVYKFKDGSTITVRVHDDAS